MRAALLVVLVGCGRLGFGGDPPADTSVPPIDIPAGTPYATVVLADGPVAYWRLGDSGGTAADATGNGHSGAVMGGVTAGQTALIKDADPSMTFDGATGYVEVPDSATLRFGGAVTLEAWVSGATFANASAMSYPRIIGKGTTGGTGHTLTVEKLTTGDMANARLELEGLSPFTLTGTTVLLPSGIHHLVGTFDGVMTKIYVDGQLDGSQPVTGTLITSTAPLDIGRRPDAMRYWQGFIDEVAVYDKALTPQQIATHYAAGR